jgi:hypothetical protein
MWPRPTSPTEAALRAGAQASKRAECRDADAVQAQAGQARSGASAELLSGSVRSWGKHGDPCPGRCPEAGEPLPGTHRAEGKPWSGPDASLQQEIRWPTRRGCAPHFRD